MDPQGDIYAFPLLRLVAAGVFVDIVPYIDAHSALDTEDLNVEIAPESPDMAKYHTVPVRGQARGEAEAVETLGAQAEHTFDDGSAVQPAFCRKMPLATFGPGFNGIWNVSPEQPALGVGVHQPAGRSNISRHIYAAEGIEGRAVPEGAAALLGQYSVLGQKQGGSERGDGPFLAPLQAHYQWHTYPGAEQVVPRVVSVAAEALDVRSEVTFYSLRKLFGLRQVFFFDHRPSAQAAGEHSRGEQGVIVEAGGAEVGISRRETPFQLVAVRPHHSGLVQLPLAVFQAPPDQRPELQRLVLVALCQGVTGCPIGNHRGIPAVAGPVPYVGAFGDNGAGDGRPAIVHIACEMPEGVEGGRIPYPVAQEGEEGIYIFGLVIGPDCGIVGLSARPVHKTSLGLVDALGGAYLGEGELLVDDFVGGVQNQVRAPLVQQGHAGAEFHLWISPQRILSLPIGLEDGPEAKALPGPQGVSAAAGYFFPYYERPVQRFCRIGTENLGVLGDMHFDRPPRSVDKGIDLAQKGFVHRGEDGPGDGHGVRIDALYADAAVYLHTDDRLSTQRLPVNGEQRRDVGGNTVPEAGVGIIGNSP